jgi:hypothetical protein
MSISNFLKLKTKEPKKNFKETKKVKEIKKQDNRIPQINPKTGIPGYN